MAKVTYKEPSSYFSPAMIKAGKEYDAQAKKASAAAKKATPAKSAKKK